MELHQQEKAVLKIELSVLLMMNLAVLLICSTPVGVTVCILCGSPPGDYCALSICG